MPVHATLSGSNIIPTSQLGTGTANNTTFLRGDGTWAVPAGGGGGSATITQANISVPYGSRDYTATITDAAVTGSSKIMITPGFYAHTEENEGSEVEMFVQSAGTGNFLVTIKSRDRNSIGGVFKLNYMLG